MKLNNLLLAFKTHCFVYYLVFKDQVFFLATDSALYPNPPPPVNTFFLLKNSSAISSCRHRSGQPLYLNRLTLSTSFFAAALFSFAVRVPLARFPEPIFLPNQGQLVNTYFLLKELFSAPRTSCYSPVRKRDVYTKSAFSCQVLCAGFFADNRIILLYSILSPCKSAVSNLNHIFFSLVKFITFIRQPSQSQPSPPPAGWIGDLHCLILPGRLPRGPCREALSRLHSAEKCQPFPPVPDYP